MKEHYGKEPRNARIKINYSGKKPKVSFSYPVNKKDSRTIGSMFVPLFFAWIVINLPLFFLFSYMEDDDFNKKDYDLKNYSEFLEYYLQGEKINYAYSLYDNKLKYFGNEILNVRNFLVIFWLVIFPCIIYFIRKDKWDKLYPDYQALFANKKYRKFNVKDIQRNGGKIYLELPIFNNVICDFNAKGDFSKYLDFFEIREHDFVCYNKRGKNKKRIRNEILWYARWYFKEEPKKDYLEVIFK